MSALLRTAAIVGAALLGGCSTIISGTSQKISITSDPTGADCTLTRDGLSIGRVNPTPGQTEVSTNRSAITVTCKKDGYEDGSNVDASGFDPAVLGNVILGGFIGVVVDASSGAASKYDSTVHVTLLPTQPGTGPVQNTSAIAPAIARPSAIPGAVDAEGSTVDRLRTLKQLYDDGAITREEYDRRRRAIVGNI